MFSSTMVATSAMRDWMTHEIGNITFRMRTPVQNSSGMTAIAMSASGTEIDSMKMKAMTPMAHCTRMSGAKVEYIWTERMSEFAREMS